jgi:hypothetical protein
LLTLKYAPVNTSVLFTLPQAKYDLWQLL